MRIAAGKILNFKALRLSSVALVTLCAVLAAGPPAAGSAVNGLPGWTSDKLDDWRLAWLRSCAREPWRTSHPKTDKATARNWKRVCAQWPPSDPMGLRRWLERNFETIPVKEPAFVTGYFEPVIEGRGAPEGLFTSPLYRMPPDLDAIQARGGKAWTRAEISSGALSGQSLEIAWVDPVDGFFLHIQGSGVLTLPGRAPVRLGYAGNNGHAYYAIGRHLIAIGAVKPDDVSMQSVAAWLRANPERAQVVMNRNARFIFFKPLRTAGPVGAAGAVLTAGRSLAADPAHIPYGLPVWLDLDGGGHGEGALQRLTVAQDTGAAIKGPARADYFWGTGDAMGEKAGRMKARGRLYMLLPRAGAQE